MLAGVLALIVGLWFGGHPSWLPGPLRSVFVQQNSNDQIVNDVLGLLQRDYYRKLNRSQLVNKGLAAAVASLGDPYSHYFDPDRLPVVPEPGQPAPERRRDRRRRPSPGGCWWSTCSPVRRRPRPAWRAGI